MARHSESDEPLVGYRSLFNDAGWWAQPDAMIFENVAVDSRVQPRIERMA